MFAFSAESTDHVLKRLCPHHQPMTEDTCTGLPHTCHPIAHRKSVARVAGIFSTLPEDLSFSIPFCVHDVHVSSIHIEV